MHTLLERYLSDVAAHLRPLPAKARADELREMRAHLEAAYAAGLARGQSEDEAARGVLAQFGTPDMVGAETVAAWRRGRRLDQRSFWGAAAGALLLSFLLPRLLDPSWDRVAITFFQRISPPGPAPWWVSAPLLVCYFLILSPVTFVVGGISGWLFPRRAVAAVGLAWSVHIAWGLTFQVFHVAHARAWFAYPLAFTPQQAMFVGIYVSVSLLGAWAGSRWRAGGRGWRGGEREESCTA